jgi:2,3-bisphosphoglycerate-independent phosphoglycerate mutase
MNAMPVKHRPIVLIVLDGWGHLDDPKYNAIAAAKTPVWDQLWRNYPHALAQGSGLAVGLPKGQMGNSEVGHLHMGAGRQVLQDLTRIDQAIAEGEFFKNKVFLETFDSAIKKNKAVHVMSLLSPGGVHSHINHLQALVKMAAHCGVKKLYIHAFLDGRDTPPKSALNSLIALEKTLEALKKSGGNFDGRIISIIGRYYAMDRDRRWERTQQAYDLLTLAKANCYAVSAQEALGMAYDRGETDEFVQPTYIGPKNQTPIKIEDGDAVIFMNFRADRAKQLSYAFTDPNFQGFVRQAWPALSIFVSLTEYANDIPSKIAFPPTPLKNIFGEYISKLGLRQLRIAETEKYAHVTFFFDGGKDKVFSGEDRKLIASPKVATYDLKPEMSAYELTEALVKAINRREYDFIICNFANPDMVGHTGNFEATVKAIEVVDNCLNLIIESLYEVGGEALITADHGNAECMYDPQTGQAHTAHTTNLVPVIYIGRDAEPSTQEGTLYDIAPTLLYLLNVKAPQEMTGKSLFKLLSKE